MFWWSPDSHQGLLIHPQHDNPKSYTSLAQPTNSGDAAHTTTMPQPEHMTTCGGTYISTHPNSSSNTTSTLAEQTWETETVAATHARGLGSRAARATTETALHARMTGAGMFILDLTPQGLAHPSSPTRQLRTEAAGAWNTQVIVNITAMVLHHVTGQSISLAVLSSLCSNGETNHSSQPVQDCNTGVAALRVVYVSNECETHLLHLQSTF